MRYTLDYDDIANMYGNYTRLPSPVFNRYEDAVKVLDRKYQEKLESCSGMSSTIDEKDNAIIIEFENGEIIRKEERRMTFFARDSRSVMYLGEYSIGEHL